MPDDRSKCTISNEIVARALAEPRPFALAITAEQVQSERLRAELLAQPDALVAFAARVASAQKSEKAAIKEWLARGMWPVIEAQLRSGGLAVSPKRIRQEIADRLKACGYKNVEVRTIRTYTQGLTCTK